MISLNGCIRKSFTFSIYNYVCMMDIDIYRAGMAKLHITMSHIGEFQILESCNQLFFLDQ